jgi:hypothetical protein
MPKKPEKTLQSLAHAGIATADEFIAAIGAAHGRGRKPPKSPARELPKVSALVPRDRFKTELERDYAAHLELQRLAGELVWFDYEPMGFRLADRCFYYPDFAVLRPSGELQFHETKGPGTHDGARERPIPGREKGFIKWRAAAERFPMFRWFLVSRGPGGCWNIREYGKKKAATGPVPA